MLRRFPLFDGLRPRIAAALFATMIFQFAGSEIIFAQVEDARIEYGRSQRLADWLLFADEFIDTRPDAIARMNSMWEKRLKIERIPHSPAELRPASVHKDVTQRVIALQPRLTAINFQAVRNGDALEGSIRLGNGDGLRFQSGDYFQSNSLSYHYVASLLLLTVSVGLLALIFGRMIARPLARISEAAGRVGGDDTVAVDIDGPREVRQLAAAFDRMQSRLLGHVGERVQSLAAMSHDLRTPLARLRLNASTVRDRETRLILEQDIAEMEEFVTAILEYLRGDDPEPRQPADIASIAMTVVDDARDAGGEVSYFGPDRLEGLTQPLKLKRLLRNVVQNGVLHAGRTRLYLDNEGSRMIFRIEDDGPGIPEDRLADVLQPFTRVENSRSPGTGGAGLGLAIARQLSHGLAGSVALSNRPEGGLLVTICLPCITGTSGTN